MLWRLDWEVGGWLHRDGQVAAGGRSERPSIGARLNPHAACSNIKPASTFQFDNPVDQEVIHIPAEVANPISLHLFGINLGPIENEGMKPGLPGP